MINSSDYIIIGAGIYGLYAAKLLTDKGLKVVVLEYEDDSFKRASYINQARIHMGYHYPRSISTAKKSGMYYHRFYEDFRFAVNDSFDKIYGIPSRFSLTSGEQFQRFCQNIDIPCIEVNPSKYFNNDLVEQAFETEECAFDAMLIKEWFMKDLMPKDNFRIYYSFRIKEVLVEGDSYCIISEDGDKYKAPSVINASYASTNQVLLKFGVDGENLKYEISEIILCNVSEQIKDVGLTVMDGPFFSVMPFGLTGYHSLTTVLFTHNKASYEYLPVFECQRINTSCTPYSLGNCNTCPARPQSSYRHMKQLAKKYLNENIDIQYVESLFAIKPILKKASMDDSRPTIVRTITESPRLITILSGKINTIYDLDEVLI